MWLLPYFVNIVSVDVMLLLLHWQGGDIVPAWHIVLVEGRQQGQGSVVTPPLALEVRVEGGQEVGVDVLVRLQRLRVGEGG